MATNGQILRWDELRSLGFASIGAYAGVGPSFTNPVRILMLDNLTDADLIVSFDGIIDKTVVASRSGKVIDVATNRLGPVNQLEQPVGDRVYIRSISALPTSGSFYVSVMYADNH